MTITLPTITHNFNTHLPANLRLGLFIDGLWGWYHSQAWQGAAAVAKAHQANLTVFIGRELDSPIEFEAQANIIYHMISPENFDGLIINTGAIGNYKSSQEIAAFCRQFEPIPVVTITTAVAGLSCVTIENEQGIRHLLTHLIEVHHHQQIAFITGPPNNIDAQIRQQIYQEILVQYNLPFNPALMVPGDFTYQGGYSAMEHLLKQQYGNFDAVVAADDETAFGALEMLHTKGVRVPQDVALVGFDDDPYSGTTIPPLTTVKQPVYQQSQRAAELLLAQINGQTTPQAVTLPSQPIIRQSCGCPSLNLKWAMVKPKVMPMSMLAQPLKTIHLEDFLPALKQDLALPPFITFNQIAELLDAFITALKDNNASVFVDIFTTLLRSQATAGKEINKWHQIISVLRRNVLDQLNHYEKIVLAEDFWQQARVIISEIAEQAQAIHRLQIEQTTEILRGISNILTATYELPEILAVLAQELPRLGIAQTYLSLYKNPQAPLEQSRLVLAYNRQGCITLNKAKVLFPTQQLIPNNIQPDQTNTPMIVVPLYFKAEPLGFALFELNHNEERVYEIIRSQLSSALKGALLVQQVQDHANHLETEVAKRTSDLTTANNRLKLYTNELERSNRELQEFAYVASHDLQEPLRKIQMFGNRLNSRYAAVLDEQGRDYINRMENAASRMQTLIEDLLKLSRITTKGKSFTIVHLNDLIQEVLSDLETRLQEVHGQVKVDPLPTIAADKTQMRQLFQNLIGNALKFHKHNTPPIVTITSQQLPDPSQGHQLCQITVTDNGIGFHENQAEKIFGVFQRLHDTTTYQGTGVGLAICRKITERHNGTITATAQPNQGATFIITLPINQ